jgi:hypothetical protein
MHTDIWFVTVNAKRRFEQFQNIFKAGLWIRIDSIRIRIQHFSSIQIRIRIQLQIRIQAKIELSKTNSF